MGLFRPFRRKFWFWWNNRHRWKALDVLLADPVLQKGIITSVSGKLPGYNFPCMLPGLHRDRAEKFFP